MVVLSREQPGSKTLRPRLEGELTGFPWTRSPAIEAIVSGGSALGAHDRGVVGAVSLSTRDSSLEQAYGQ
jgi:hypothetical protein